MKKSTTETDEKTILKEKIAMREKQLQDLAETVTEFNDRLNQALSQNREFDAENRKLTKELEVKIEMLTQELRDKEINFAKLQTLERENEKLKEQLAPKKETKQAPKKIFSNIELKQNNHVTINSKTNSESSSRGQSNLIGQELQLKHNSSEEEEKTPENETEEELLERIRKNLNLAE